MNIFLNLVKKDIYVLFFFQWGDFQFVSLVLLLSSAFTDMHFSKRMQSSFQQI